MPHLDKGYRGPAWEEATTRAWDVVVIGGGIVGAAVARETARAGLSTLLLEQRDFAWGTSGRSSKMIHGGLRYLKERQIQLTRESVRQRESLLRCGGGLVEPLGFLYVVYRGDRPGPWTLEFGLSVYDLLKRSGRSHHELDRQGVWLSAPNLDLEGMRGGFQYFDATTDDARLVFRVLREAMGFGAVALNYARAEELLRDGGGRVRAVAVTDAETGAASEVRTAFVVKATGAWAAELGGADGMELRPLRGSHLILARETLPVAQAVTFAHPSDGRPVFAYPWEGVTLVGTTDLDHAEQPDLEPTATRSETDYLLEAVRLRFKDLPASGAEVMGTFAGVRPVIFGGRDRPSREPREHAVWEDENVLTLAGGKLTTFYPMARQALRRVVAGLGGRAPDGGETDALEPIPKEAAERAADALSPLPRLLRRRLAGRLGPDLGPFLERTRPEDLREIPGTPYTWAELRWAFEREAVLHLDDLLLRRVRLGHLLPDGGAALRAEIEARLRDLSAWSPRRWEDEWDRYGRLWSAHYGPPSTRP